MATASWVAEACAQSCARRKWQAMPAYASLSSTGTTLRLSRRQLHEKLVLTSHPRVRGPEMAGTATIAISTREKLERAKATSSLLAQLSTEEKNRLLLGIADALEAYVSDILQANAEDIEQANLCGAMADRLLLTPQRIHEMAKAVRDV